MSVVGGSARQVVRRAFVLSGGGNLGAAQVGAVQALLERGLTPDLLVGTSAGAINAAYLAHDPSLEGALRLGSIWTSLRGRDVFAFPRMPWHLLTHLRQDALLHNDRLRLLLRRHLPYERIEEAPVRLRVVATEYATGKAVAFHSGSVVDAVLASTALPGLFPPVSIGGRLYLDGGIADNVPISPAVGAGARDVYVVHVGLGCPETGRLRALDVMSRAIDLLLNRTLADDVKRFSPPARIVVLPTPRPAPSRIWNLSHSAALIAQGRELAGKFLDALDDAGAAPASPREAATTRIQIA
jgi:NTE family protein